MNEHPFIYSFNKYELNSFYQPNTSIAMEKSRSLPHGTHIHKKKSESGECSGLNVLKSILMRVKCSESKERRQRMTGGKVIRKAS